MDKVSFNLRPMVEQDIDLTLQWRNDDAVRNNAVTSHVISKEEHTAMFKYNNSVKLVFELDSIPVGYVQVSREEDGSGEWSFHLGKEWRGMGLSSIMLEAALYYLITREGYIQVKSRVLPHNTVSKHLHYKLGFNAGEDENGIHTYWKVL